MVKTELIKRSPLRLLERSIHGGVGPGNIGMIAARKGTGKTACLVHIATDQLFQNKHVIHLSFAGRTDHIVSWYEDIFSEIAKKRHLEEAMSVHDEVIKNRVIMNFNQDGVTAGQVISSLTALVEAGGFSADVVIVDGFEFERGAADVLLAIHEFARERNLAVWFSASTHREDPSVNENGVPTMLVPYIEHVAVLITLTPEADHLKLQLVKDHDQYRTEDLHLELDSKTLLIREE